MKEKEKFMDKNYSYVDCEEGSSQYDEYDLKEQTILPATYVRAKVKADEGNPYIEAIPYPRDDDNIERAYTRILADYDYSKVSSMSKLEKMLRVGTLRGIRFPLPFHKSLEFYFYNALLNSYRARKQMHSKSAEIKYTLANNTQFTDCILMGNSATATNSGFSLIGYSGCGKSSAIETLISHYPQVIIHFDDNGGYYPQIVYLVVNCVANSNFSALYESIGDAIDKAFGNLEPVYSQEISRIAGLGRKAEKVKEYVEKFAIGIIIFDEIQLLNFDHTRENSFDSLLTLSNRTKVAIAVVGTEDARAKMFKELRTARRVGNVINGNLYCNNKQYFSFLVAQLFQYQWFDKHIEINDELIDALYEVTQGIVDQLIGVYSCMHYDYLDRKKKTEINGDYVKKVAKKYYPGLQNVLGELASSEKEEMLKQIRENAELHINEIIDKTKQDVEAETIIISNSVLSAEIIEFKKVVENINAIYDDYSLYQIEDAFKKVIARKSSKGKTEREITKQVLEQLSKLPKRKSNKDKIVPPDMEHMRDFLGL